MTRMSTARLSPRERQVVVLLCDGEDRTYREAATELGIKYATVRTHVARILLRYPSQKRPRAALREVYSAVVTTA